MRPNEVARVLSALVPTRRPVYLWGPPGSAKFSVARQTAEGLKLALVDVRSTLLDPIDLRGLPRVTGDAAVWCPPAFLPSRGAGAAAPHPMSRTIDPHQSVATDSKAAGGGYASAARLRTPARA
jgi:hypothetical protein